MIFKYTQFVTFAHVSDKRAAGQQRMCVLTHAHVTELWDKTNTPCELWSFNICSPVIKLWKGWIFRSICRLIVFHFVVEICQPLFQTEEINFLFQYKMRISSNQNQIFLLEKGNSKLSGWGWNSKWIQSSHWHLNPGQLLLLVASLLLFIKMQCNSMFITEGFNCTTLQRCQISDSR